MQEVLAAFPRRPLILHPPAAPAAGRVWSSMGLVFCAFVVIALLAWLGPPLQNDWDVRGKTVPMRGSVESGQCKSKLIFHFCEGTIVAGSQRAPIRQDFTYLFVDLHFGAYTISVMGDPARPALLTTDLGQDKLINRTISTVIAIVFMFAATVLGMRSAWRSSHMRNAVLAASGQTLLPLAVGVTMSKTNRWRNTWHVRGTDGAITEWNMPGAARPFQLTALGQALAMASPIGGAVFPLDAELRWVELTDAERAAIFDAQARSIAALQARLDTIEAR